MLLKPRTEEELKETLFTNLKKPDYEFIDKFLGNLLEERCQHEGWLYNDLVLNILHDCRTNLEMVNSMLKKPVDLGYESVVKKITQEHGGPICKGNDNQIDDLLAELNALNWIIKEGYCCIEKLDKSELKTPDFKAKLNQAKFLFEAKDIQLPKTIKQLLFKYVETECYLVFPKLYKEILFLNLDITVLSGDDSLSVRDHYIPTEVQKFFIDNLRLNAKKRSFNAAEVYSWVTRKKENIKVQIQITPTQRNPEYPSGGTHILMSPEWSERKGLLEKLKSSISNACNQLCENNLSDKSKKLVLLNWQKPWDFDTGKNLEQDLEQLVIKYNDDFAARNKDIQVVLLQKYEL